MESVPRRRISSEANTLRISAEWNSSRPSFALSFFLACFFNSQCELLNSAMQCRGAKLGRVSLEVEEEMLEEEMLEGKCE